MNKFTLPILILGSLIPLIAAGSRPPNELTEVWQPVPTVIGTPASGAPSDAIVLFNGTTLDAWEPVRPDEAGWKIEDAAMLVVPRPHPCDLRTKQSFGDVQLHLEWRVPVEIKDRGQDRGNSGIFFMGRQPFTKRASRKRSARRKTPDSTARSSSSSVLSKYLGPRIKFTGELAGVDSSVTIGSIHD
jgi:hypothetical protein